MKSFIQHIITEGSLRLFSYNPITGIWKSERGVAPETQDQWLKVFQKGEPDKHFVISKRIPKGKPK
jgi:hypothetical protein